MGTTQLFVLVIALPLGSVVWGNIFTMGELSVELINFPLATSLPTLTERAKTSNWLRLLFKSDYYSSKNQPCFEFQLLPNLYCFVPVIH